MRERGRERERERERKAHKIVLNAYNFINTETQGAKIQVPNNHKRQGTVSWAIQKWRLPKSLGSVQLPPAEQIKQGALYISGSGLIMDRVMVL